MSTPHKATERQWAINRRRAENDDATDSVLLEVADRVAALENAANSHSTPSDSQIRSSTPDHFRGAPEMVAMDNVYNLSRQHGAAHATCPHVRTSDEGTSYCALAEKTASQPRQEEEAAPSPAPAGGLVTRMRSALGMREFLSDAELSSMIHVVADWLQVHSGIIANGSQWGEMLRKEADR